MIIAEVKTPKQRITKIMGYILKYNKDTDDYSVHSTFYGEDQANCKEIESQGQGYYNLTLDEAWDFFKGKTQELFSYGTGTFDKIA